MSQALIVVEASGNEITNLQTTARMVSALRQAISTSAKSLATVQVVAANKLMHPAVVKGELDSSLIQIAAANDVVICPLTLNMPPGFTFSAEAVFQACRDVPSLRQRVSHQLGYATKDGCFWLPIVLTAKGPVYGEVISLAGELSEGEPAKVLSFSDLSYYQPFHLSDSKRQQIYQLGKYLLKLVSAPPATYLVQFGFCDSEVYFDRLWPFPFAPAIASLGVQAPDLFACHWFCLTNIPVFDLTIIPPMNEQTLQTLGC